MKKYFLIMSVAVITFAKLQENFNKTTLTTHVNRQYQCHGIEYMPALSRYAGIAAKEIADILASSQTLG